MKKILMILMVIVLTLLIASFGSGYLPYIIGYYNSETSEYHVRNVSNRNFKELKVYLKLRNNEGHEQKVVYYFETLQAREDYTIDLSDISDISEAHMYNYSYYINMEPLNIIAICSLIIFLLILLRIHI